MPVVHMCQHYWPLARRIICYLAFHFPRNSVCSSFSLPSRDQFGIQSIIGTAPFSFSSSSFLFKRDTLRPSIHPFCAATNSCALLRTISLDGIWFFLFWFHPLFDPATWALGLIKEVELERLICLFSSRHRWLANADYNLFRLRVEALAHEKQKQKQKKLGWLETLLVGFCSRSYSASENRQSSGREESAINILFIDNSSGPSDSFCRRN